MPEIKQINSQFSQYYAEFQNIAADLNWKPSAVRNTLRMRWSEEMKGFFTYSYMLEELPAFVTVIKKWDNQIPQLLAEKAVQNTGVGIGFASPRPRPPQKAPEIVAARKTAGYT
jgi:hypothetical protein